MNEQLIDIFSDVEDFHWWFEGRRIFLKKAIGSLRKNGNPKILDVGCGSGSNLDFLSQFGEVYGIDKLDLAIKYCKEKGHKKVKISDACNLLFKDEVFDMVTFLDVLEHLKDDGKAVKEAGRVLKKGGKIIVTVPALPWIWSRHDSQQNHHRRYCISDLVALGKKRRMTLELVRYFNFFLLPPIAVVRMMSRLKPFHGLGEYDQKINFEISKIQMINEILLSIFKAEIYLSNWFRYPLGVSILAIYKK